MAKLCCHLREGPYCRHCRLPQPAYGGYPPAAIPGSHGGHHVRPQVPIAPRATYGRLGRTAAARDLPREPGPELFAPRLWARRGTWLQASVAALNAAPMVGPAGSGLGVS